jgi:hypothetical protein
MTYWKRCPNPIHQRHGGDDGIYRGIIETCDDCTEHEGLVPVEGVLIEHPETEERTWYCARFGIPGYERDICERYGHLADGQGCGYRLLIELPAVVGGEETPSAADRVTRIGLDAGLDD